MKSLGLQGESMVQTLKNPWKVILKVIQGSRWFF